MPMCHANSLYFFGAFAYCGAPCTIYSRKSFDPEHCVRTLAEGGATFTSLVPTHYIMMLGLPAAVRARYDVERGDEADDLLGAGAPRHQARGHGVFPQLRPVRALRLDRSGWVTMLQPDEQFTKLGSVGRECVGSRPIRLLDADGQRSAGRRARRALLLQPLHVRRLLEAAGEDGGGVPRRLLHGRRHGPARRGRLSSISSTARAT